MIKEEEEAAGRTRRMIATREAVVGGRGRRRKGR